MKEAKAAEKRGGLVLRVDGALVFLPATVAVKVAPKPRIARVAGAPPELLGIALHEGEIMPVIAIGVARESMVVCSYLGELIGLVGGTVVTTGMFDVGERPDLVVVGDERAAAYELAPIYARVQAGGWAGKWGG